jgi:hypothetical protein
MSNKTTPAIRSAYIRRMEPKALKDPRMNEPGVKAAYARENALIALMPVGVLTAIVMFQMMTSFIKADMTHNAAENPWTAGLVTMTAIGLLALHACWTAASYTMRASAHIGCLDDDFQKKARKRVHAVINRSHPDARTDEDAFFARALIEKPDEHPFGRELLVRLDGIAKRMLETKANVAHDEKMQTRANEVAYQASMDLIRSIREQAENDDALIAVEDLARDCRAIVDGREIDAPTASYAPTARIARIISTAERMLADHPDLVDGQGARIDALIRVHVPRLLDRHRAAAASSSSKDLEAVDAQLDSAIEKIRESVQEAARTAHDEAMEALSIELGFLSLRRGTTPLLSSVA